MLDLAVSVILIQETILAVCYSGDLNNKHLNSNLSLVRIQMSGIQMVVWYSDHHLNTGLVFKWQSEYWTKFSPVFKWHSNKGHLAIGQLSTI